MRPMTRARRLATRRSRRGVWALLFAELLLQGGEIGIHVFVELGFRSGNGRDAVVFGFPSGWLGRGSRSEGRGRRRSLCGFARGGRLARTRFFVAEEGLLDRFLRAQRGADGGGLRPLECDVGGALRGFALELRLLFLNGVGDCLPNRHFTIVADLGPCA